MRRTLTIAILAVLAIAGASAVHAQTSVAGEWEGTFNTPGGARPFRAVFVVEGEKLTGTVKRPNGDVPLTGTIKGDEISFNYTIAYGENALTLMFAGKVSGDAMSGTVSFNGNSEDSWNAKRAAK